MDTSVYEAARDQFMTCETDHDRFNAMRTMLDAVVLMCKDVDKRIDCVVQEIDSPKKGYRNATGRYTRKR